MQKISLNELNLDELSYQESNSIEGGGLFKKGIWSYLATELIDNWESIKRGAERGWNFDK
jgi:hypothetical protein